MVTSINGIQQIAKIYGENNKVNSVPKTEKVGKKDELTVSFESQLIQKATKYISELPDIRENKVNELQQAIKSGSYNIKGEEIISKIRNSLNLKG